LCSLIFLTACGEKQPSVTPTLPPPCMEAGQIEVTQSCTEVGQTCVSQVDGMVLVCVPEGDFVMGSVSYYDPNAHQDEKPRHTIFLDAFWIDQTEVTKGMYAMYVFTRYYRSHFKSIGALARGNDYPAVDMSWNDANEYCEWVGRQLPSEAQWEKAARGTDERIYPWGNEIPNCTLANYRECGMKPMLVGRLPSGASPYGALDMAGNVKEWVLDQYEADYYTWFISKRWPSNPVASSLDGNDTRVLRGGSWFNSMLNIRSSNREYSFDVDDLSIPTGTVGFRCVFLP
jgi:formylglycine-generating enzyme required for sulfatase activity